MIPGNNLLNMCLRIIAPQTVYWYQSVSSPLNSIGQNVTEYAAPLSILGSFQPVSRQVIFNLGLDMQKSYFVFYSSNNFQDIERDKSPDLLVQGLNVYQIASCAEWFDQDGWVGALVCYSGFAVPALVNGKYISKRKI